MLYAQPRVFRVFALCFEWQWHIIIFIQFFLEKKKMYNRHVNTNKQGKTIPSEEGPLEHLEMLGYFYRVHDDNVYMKNTTTSPSSSGTIHIKYPAGNWTRPQIKSLISRSNAHLIEPLFLNCEYLSMVFCFLFDNI